MMRVAVLNLLADSLAWLMAFLPNSGCFGVVLLLFLSVYAEIFFWKRSVSGAGCSAAGVGWAGACSRLLAGPGRISG